MTVRDMTVEQAAIRRAELIRQVREGTPSWTPKPGWSDQFTDDEVWDAWLRVARDEKLTTAPVMECRAAIKADELRAGKE